MTELSIFRVVEFRTEDLMKKAVEKVNKHNLNGRPLKVKEVSSPGVYLNLHSGALTTELHPPTP